jgi:hypothetical protein
VNAFPTASTRAMPYRKMVGEKLSSIQCRPLSARLILSTACTVEAPLTLCLDRRAALLQPLTSCSRSCAEANPGSPVLLLYPPWSR